MDSRVSCTRCLCRARTRSSQRCNAGSLYRGVVVALRRVPALVTCAPVALATRCADADPVARGLVAAVRFVDASLCDAAIVGGAYNLAGLASTFEKRTWGFVRADWTDAELEVAASVCRMRRLATRPRDSRAIALPRCGASSTTAK